MDKAVTIVPFIKGEEGRLVVRVAVSKGTIEVVTASFLPFVTLHNPDGTLTASLALVAQPVEPTYQSDLGPRAAPQAPTTPVTLYTPGPSTEVRLTYVLDTSPASFVPGTRYRAYVTFQYYLSASGQTETLVVALDVDVLPGPPGAAAVVNVSVEDVGTGAETLSGSFPSAPAAPTSLLATPGNAQVALVWTPGAGAATFNLYRGTTAGAEVLYQAGLSTASYLDRNVVNGTTYYYKATDVANGLESGFSNEASATPSAGGGGTLSAPQHLVCTPGVGQLALTWDAVAGADGYVVLASDISGAETPIVNVAATAYTDTLVCPGVKMYFVVYAYSNAGAQSPNSNEASGTPL